MIVGRSMKDKTKKYLQGYINNVMNASSKGRMGNILLIKHNSALSLQKGEYEGIGTYHKYQSLRIARPYEPFLDIIKEFVKEKISEDVSYSLEEFFEKTDVYPVHREMLKNYFNSGRCMRREELLLGEYQYEKQKFQQAIVRMLFEIAEQKELFLLLDEINVASTAVLWILESIIQQENKRIKLVLLYNEAGERFSFAQENLQRLVQLCEDKDIVYNWTMEQEERGSVLEKENFDASESAMALENLMYAFEYDLADYHFKKIFNRIERERMQIDSKDEQDLIRIYFWICLALEDYSYALLLCEMLAKLEFEQESQKKRAQFLSEQYKMLIHLYNENSEQFQASLQFCENLADEVDDEKIVFQVRLLKIMENYSGFRNLWICENDTKVEADFIELCKKYGYINHLAHIYVYCYNCDYTNFTTTEGIEDRIKEFHQGIAIAKELKNEQFLLEAYRKNVMLASLHGYFKVCIYFYEKMLEIVKRSKDEVEEAGIYNGMGYSNSGLEHYEKANRYYNQALILYHKYAMSDEIVETLYNLGINAMLAGDYKNACNYLLEADEVLCLLKQSTMKTCNISKLFGLIALASFRLGGTYRASLYLNKAKQFLAHAIGKKEEEKVHVADDSLFLVYFVAGLLKQWDKNYTEAKQCFQKAEFYMQRSTGGKFFNYPEFAFDNYWLLRELGEEDAARESLMRFQNYCKENHYRYREKIVNEVLGITKKGSIKKPGKMLLKDISLSDITELMKQKSCEKEKDNMVRTIRFFHILQKFTSRMNRSVKEEISSVLPMFKNNFSMDKVLLIRCKDGENEIAYSDLGYEVTKPAVDAIVAYFKEKPVGFVVSKDGMEHEEYDKIVSMFQEEKISSFVAVPVFENEILNSVFITYIEIKDNWTSAKERSILGQEDLESFTYVFSQISNAMEKMEMENELVEANKKLKDQMEQLIELKNEAEVANEAKSNFLANMSHEIRTPMNAIIGMAEIALRGEQSKEQRETTEQIMASGKTLLAIINDILDFSKIESGKMEINVEKYQPLSIVKNVVNIVTTRIGEKDVELIIDMAPDMPRELLGDSVRLNQIIINLANNAVKFTRQGEVRLKISYERSAEKPKEEIILKIVVEDTGIGIKKQDLGKLFQSFEQLDSKRNRNIEGTGLGLSITRQLLKLMDGNISVESEYEKGSRFSCKLPQKIVTDEPGIVVEGAEDKKVALMIVNPYVKQQLYEDLERLGVSCITLMSENELEGLRKTNVGYLFVEYPLFSEKVLHYIQMNPWLTGVLLVNFQSSASYSDSADKVENLKIVKKPLYSLNLANILNKEEIVYGVEDENAGDLDFVAPEAEILIVDDNTINLTVAKGLLEPLEMQIDTAASGKEAIEKISIKQYDLIFMDHMMPEIDGVETTHIIRRFHEEYQDVPIIALTANAVEGTREMFLREGMNDFVAKPIDFSVIVGKLKHWLPGEKIQKVQGQKKIKREAAQEVSIEIEGLDTKFALNLLGEEKLFWSVLKDYYRVIEKKCKLIKSLEEAENWKGYTIEVHALKSASRQIGAISLANKAERMEMAGNGQNGELIHECTDEMLAQYKHYLEILKPYFPENEKKEQKQKICKEILEVVFRDLREALEELDLDKMEDAMKELSQYEFDGWQKEMFEQLENAVEEIDSETCEEVIQVWEERMQR